MQMVSRNNNQARNVLQSAGLYCTKGRIAILEVLFDSSRPLKQDEVAARLCAKVLDRTTVYRTLTRLVDAGIVHKAYVQERAWYFELADKCTVSQCHPHFTCIKCGAKHCLTGMSIPMTENSHKGFIIHRQQVRFEGICPACS